MIRTEAKAGNHHAPFMAGLPCDLEHARVVRAGDAACFFGRYFDFAAVVVDLGVEVAHYDR